MEKIVELLKILKRIYISEMCDFNDTLDIIQEANIDELNKFFEENNVNTLDILESNLDIKYILKNDFKDKDFERTPQGIKDYFSRFYCIKLSDIEAFDICEKYF